MNDRDLRNLNAYTWRARTRARLNPCPEYRADLRRVDPVYDGPPFLASALREHGSIVHTDRGPAPASTSDRGFSRRPLPAIAAAVLLGGCHVETRIGLASRGPGMPAKLSLEGLRLYPTTHPNADAST